MNVFGNPRSFVAWPDDGNWGNWKSRFFPTLMAALISELLMLWAASLAVAQVTPLGGTSRTDATSRVSSEVESLGRACAKVRSEMVRNREV